MKLMLVFSVLFCVSAQAQTPLPNALQQSLAVCQDSRSNILRGFDDFGGSFRAAMEELTKVRDELTRVQTELKALKDAAQKD